LWLPKLDHPPVEVFVWDPLTFELGLDTVEVEPGELARIYSPGRTAVDLMRMRNKLGESVAYVALRRYLARRDARVADLMMYAKALDVGRSGPGGGRSPGRIMKEDVVTRTTRAGAGGRAYLGLQNLARRQAPDPGADGHLCSGAVPRPPRGQRLRGPVRPQGRVLLEAAERDKTVLQQSSARIRARLRVERAAPDEVSSTHSASIPAS